MKVIFELQVQDAGIATKLDLLKSNLKEIQKELKGVDQDSKAFESLAEEAALTRVEILKLTDEQKNLKKEFAAAQVPTDSLAGLRIEYSKLVSEITKLSKAERESEAGKALIANAAAVKGEINEIQESVGNFTGNVGNYKNSILSASDALGSFGGSLGAQSGILNQAIGLFGQAEEAAKGFGQTIKQGVAEFRQSINGFKDYLKGAKEVEKANEDVAESTEAVGDAVEQTSEAGAEAGKNLTESAKGTTLFSRAGNLLKSVLAGLGIGLVIALIVGLIGVFQKFAPVVDFVERAVAGLSAIFDVLVARTARLVSAFQQLVSGNFTAAFNEASAAVDGIGSAMVDAAQAAADLRREMQDLEDAQKDFTLTTARAEAAVAKLSVALKDRTRSDSERLKIADQITKIETENLNQKIALIDKELDIERRKLLVSGQITEEQSKQIAQGNFDLARQLEDEFKLQQDQADRIRELLVQRTQAEGQSATLLERVQNRRNQIIEDGKNRQEAAAQKSAQIAEKQNKELEAQANRIRELQKAIRELDVSTLTNEFDKQATDIENKRADALEKVAVAREALKKKIAAQGGVLTEADQRETALISEQTASIIAAYQKQLDEVSTARNQAIEDQKKELVELSLEVRNLAEQNAERIAEAQVEILNTDFGRQQAELLSVLNERKKALTEQLADGSISQKRFKDEFLAAQEAFNIGSFRLEQDRAAKAKEVNDKLEEARIESAKTTLAVRLAAIQADFDAEIASIRAKAIAEGTDPSERIALAQVKFAELKKTAELDYQKTVNEAVKDNELAQLASIKNVDDAEQKAQDDKLRRLEEEKAAREELQNALIDGANTVSGALFAIQRNRIENELNTAVGALDAEYAKKKDAAQGNAAELEKLDKEYQKKREALEKDAANKRKKTAITEAIVQGALAVVKALPNLVLAALAAVTTAAQIAVMSSQTFAQGGAVKLKSGMFGGRYHSQGGTKGRFSDGTEVEVEKDEVFFILNRRASSKISQLSNFNQLHGGRKFETGGSLDFTPQVGQPGEAGASLTVVAVAQFTDEQVNFMATEISNQTADKTQKAVALGLEDSNRRAERELSLDENRQV